MVERIKFIAAAKQSSVTMTSLCDLFGIAPKTGYKWLKRFEEHGVEGLKDRSRRPLTNSRAVEPAIADRLVALRKKHPTWGPRKLLVVLEEREPELAWPAPSTVTELLRREGLLHRRLARPKRRIAWTTPLSHAKAPNDVWSADFKGYFLVGDGSRCDPLTVTDACSRYLLCCKGVPSQSMAAVRPILERTFRTYGMPRALRTDNGPPFGSAGKGPLSSLAVWLIKLGVKPEYIQPGKPQQNGRHERMHLTLKAETARPPAITLSAQQRRFDAFRTEYNHERPHEALGQSPPAAHYAPSMRPYPRRLPELEYPGYFEVRNAKHSGEIKWAGRTWYISEALAGETLGLFEVEDGCWEVYFGPYALGRLHRALPDLGFVWGGDGVLPMFSV